MRKRDDMNLWWVALAVFLGGWFCLLTGCSAEDKSATPANTERFELTYSQHFPGLEYVHILRDRETDNEYLFYKSGYGGGLAMMPEPMEEEPFTATETRVYNAAPPAADHIPDATEMVDVYAPPSEPELLDWFTVTAYCPCTSCSDTWGDMTATGVRATEGRTIAVDPKVIPYGTVVYFEGPDGTLTGYVAEDCGGAINGNDIDLYFDTHEEAKAWGVKERDVYVMPEGNA